MNMEDVKFAFAELTRLNLEPGEVLIIKIKSKEFYEESFSYFQREFQKAFPKNKVSVIYIGESEEITFQTIKSMSKCDEESIGYCNNCNCGKREMALTENV